jgi:hypothetical protein
VPPAGIAAHGKRRADRLPIGGDDLRRDVARVARVARCGECDLGGERAVGARVDGGVFDRLDGRGLQPHRAENAAEHPVIAAALGGFGVGIGGYLGDIDLQQVVGRRAEFHERRDIVMETIKCALVGRAGEAAVHLHGGVGHHALEHEADAAALPGLGHGEAQAVETVFIGLGDGFLAVVVGAESLQFPIRRHGDGGLLARAAAAGDGEFPRHGVLRAVAREVELLGLDLCGGQRERRRAQETDDGGETTEWFGVKLHKGVIISCGRWK